MEKITEEQYHAAIAAKKEADKVIQAFHLQEQEAFDARWEKLMSRDPSAAFKDDELVYSAAARCDKCQAGLAYPKNCGVHHQWTCSAVLKGTATDDGHGAYPFAFYSIKSENDYFAQNAKASTRPKS